MSSYKALKELIAADVSLWKPYGLKTGIQFPIGTTVGKGLFFPHWSCNIINWDAVISDWCIIYQDVTKGRSSDGKTTSIGSNCTIYAGTIIIGGIMFGDWSELCCDKRRS